MASLKRTLKCSCHFQLPFTTKIASCVLSLCPHSIPTTTNCVSYVQLNFLSQMRTKEARVLREEADELGLEPGLMSGAFLGLLSSGLSTQAHVALLS